MDATMKIVILKGSVISTNCPVIQNDCSQNYIETLPKRDAQIFMTELVSVNQVDEPQPRISDEVEIIEEHSRQFDPMEIKALVHQLHSTSNTKKKLAKTSTERSRESRMRRKVLLSRGNPNTVLVKKVPATVAERSRKARVKQRTALQIIREKLLLKTSAQHVQGHGERNKSINNQSNQPNYITVDLCGGQSSNNDRPSNINALSTNGCGFSRILENNFNSNCQQTLSASSKYRSVPLDERLTAENSVNKETVHYNHQRIKKVCLTAVEFGCERLSDSKFETIKDKIKDLIFSNENQSMSTRTCETIYNDVVRMKVSVEKVSNILLLSETNTYNDHSDIEVSNFYCVYKFNRDRAQQAGVTVTKNKNNTARVLTAFMDIYLRNATEIDAGITAVGEVCVAQCLMDDEDQEIIIVTVYIYPHESVKNIIKFLHRRLSAYGSAGAKVLLDVNYDNLPLVLAGNFNINFSSNDAKQLIEFLHNNFQLNLNDNLKIPSNHCKTNFNAIFSRYIDQLDSKTYISYFNRQTSK